ncbi:MAG: TonB-dependent receptor [Novosphingobium sp.]|nr:TonB-dependent receptor [Novosphingobium sp.]
MTRISSRALTPLCCSALALSATAAFSPALADEQDGPASVSSASESSDAIIVTARRKEERLTDVPVSVAVYSPQLLAERGVTNIQELATLTPGLAVTSGATGGRNRPAFELRGIFAADTLGPQDQAIGIYVNEIYVARPNGTAQTFYDLENVQTLFGPQGTLFGRNSTAGAILVTTAKPTDAFEGKFSVGYGNYDRVSLEGMINVPLAESARLRLAGIFTDNKGYTLNTRDNSRLDDEHYWSVRGALDIDLTDRLRNLITAEYFRSDNHGWAVHTSYTVPLPSAANPTANQVRLPDGTVVNLAVAVPGLYAGTINGLIAADKADGPRRAYSGRPEYVNTRTATVSNVTEFDLTDELVLKNIFGYRWVKDAIGHDSDGLPLAILGGRVGEENVITFRQKQYSNELQLQGNTLDGKLDFIIGAYYFHERTHESQMSFTLVDTAAGATSPTVNPYISTNKSTSVFAQATYDFTPELSLTAGGRYTWDKREMIWTGAYRALGKPTQACNFTPAFDATDAIACHAAAKAKFKDPTYTVSLNYKLAPDTLIYVAHRRGYRAGGFNGRALTLPEATPFAPETVKDAELGFKGNWQFGSGSSLSANLALYKTWYSDIQRTVVFATPTGPTSSIVNAAQATIKGFEFDATLRPVRPLSLSVNWGMADAIHKKFQYLAAPGGVTTNIPFGNAKHTVNASATITPFDTPDLGKFNLTGTMSYRSSWYPATDMPVFVRETRNPARTIFNVNADWQDVMGSPVSAQFWVKNLTNKNYVLGSLGLVTSLGFVTNTYSDPRTYGLTLTYRWGQ